ncbi:MAG: GxxExxY protein [Prevotella sp.]|jgi:GxxExxY protein|nr:GxxExxY protein [Prevotella sp.]
MTNGELITFVINAGSKIHQSLGAGLRQDVYEECLVHELSKKGIASERQKALSVEFEELKFEKAFTVDLLVEGKLVVGIKPENAQEGLFGRKVETYVKLCGQKTGLIIDFNAENFRAGVRILENSLKPVTPHRQHYTYYGHYKKNTKE